MLKTNLIGLRFCTKEIHMALSSLYFKSNYPCPPKIAWLDLFFCMLVDFLWHVHKQNSTGEVEFCSPFAYHHDFALEKQSTQYYLHRKLKKGSPWKSNIANGSFIIFFCFKGITCFYLYNFEFYTYMAHKQHSTDIGQTWCMVMVIVSQILS